MAESYFYRALRRICDERGCLLIFDEVQTGVGRTGDPFFAGSAAGDGVVPDIVTLAKALGSGVPVGACLVTDKVADRIKENDLGTTYGGGMLAMRAVTATLEAIDEDRMMENARESEEYLRRRLRDVPAVASLRGRGLLLGVEFAEPIAAGVVSELLARRIITGASSEPRVLRLLPPLNVTAEQLDMFVDAVTAITAERG